MHSAAFVGKAEKLYANVLAINICWNLKTECNPLKREKRVTIGKYQIKYG